MQKRLKTLKDIKDFLCKIPDEDLESFAIGHNFEGDGEVCVVASEEDYKKFGNYPQMRLLNKYIKNICKYHESTLDANNDLEDESDVVSTDNYHQNQRIRPVCQRCWKDGKIKDDCPDCKGTGKREP